MSNKINGGVKSTTGTKKVLKKAEGKAQKAAESAKKNVNSIKTKDKQENKISAKDLSKELEGLDFDDEARNKSNKTYDYDGVDDSVAKDMLKDVEDDIALVEEEIKKIERKIDELERERDLLNHEDDDYESRVESIKSQLDSCKIDLSEQKFELSQLNQEKYELEQQVGESKSDSSSSSSSGSSKSLSSSSGSSAAVDKAASYIGKNESEMEKEFGAELPNGLWCAAFVNNVMKQTYGKENLPDWYNNCNVNSCSEVLRAAGDNAFKDSSQAKPGDLIVFNSSRGVARHIGIVESVKDGKVTTIEGNSTGGKVCRRTYDVNNTARINSYIRMDIKE